MQDAIAKKMQCGSRVVKRAVGLLAGEFKMYTYIPICSLSVWPMQ